MLRNFFSLSCVLIEQQIYNQMKKLFFTLIAILTLTATTFAQEAKTIAIAESKSELAASKVSGEYTYVLPSTVTAEQVKKNAGYYISYFTVGYDESSHKATVKLVNDERISRMVMGRFLSACGIRKLKVDEETITLDKFMETYLK